MQYGFHTVVFHLCSDGVPALIFTEYSAVLIFNDSPQGDFLPMLKRW